MVSRPRGKTRKLLVTAGVFGALLIVLALVLDEQLLCLKSPLQPSDAIVVLGGEPDIRVRAAAALATNGFAPRVIVSGEGDCDDNRRLLERYGVRTNIVELECKSQTTQQNAELTAKLLRQHECKRVIIVTSWFHSRRAVGAFRRYAPEIEFLSAPAPRTQLWRYERGYIASEYLKTIWYALRYGILPARGPAVPLS
jgi:uncharacterized SAM-binding protein YcdF (DUF218 family)